MGLNPNAQLGTHFDSLWAIQQSRTIESITPLIINNKLLIIIQVKLHMEFGFKNPIFYPKMINCNVRQQNSIIQEKVHKMQE